MRLDLGATAKALAADRAAAAASAAAGGRGRARQPRRRHRRRGPGARRRLAGPGRRRPSTRRRDAPGQTLTPPLGRPRDVEHDRPPLGRGSAPHHRSPDRPAGASRRGAPSASRPRPASTPTPRAPPRSCWATTRRPGSRRAAPGAARRSRRPDADGRRLAAGARRRHDRGHGPSALWYATRGTGAMTLVLLTASVVLGIGEVRAWRPGGAPRFAIAAMHRTVSLLAVALLGVHIGTTLLDPFPPIAALNAVVPFKTDYRPLWLGLGTVASDLLVALAITSLVRRRLGYRAWRGLHWLAYACWPVALVHGIGAGSDTQSTWMLALTTACVGAVLVALGARLASEAVPPALRIGGSAAAVLAALALVVWLPLGPLAPGWARRAGTPTAVLDGLLAAHPPRSRPACGPPGAPLRRDAGRDASTTAPPTMAPRSPTCACGSKADRAACSGSVSGGSRCPEGGLRMDRSAVTLGPAAGPIALQRPDPGPRRHRDALAGRIGGRPRGAPHASSSRSQGDTIAGRVRGTPVGAMSLPRLLAGAHADRPLSLAEHLALHGPSPRGGPQLIERGRARRAARPRRRFLPGRREAAQRGEAARTARAPRQRRGGRSDERQGPRAARVGAAPRPGRRARRRGRDRRRARSSSPSPTTPRRARRRSRPRCANEARSGGQRRRRARSPTSPARRRALIAYLDGRPAASPPPLRRGRSNAACGGAPRWCRTPRRWRTSR